ncbi:MAG: hypothetical protein ACMUIA_08745, partial [bacterium]
DLRIRSPSLYPAELWALLSSSRGDPLFCNLPYQAIFVSFFPSPVNHTDYRVVWHQFRKFIEGGKARDYSLTISEAEII